jgi:hypothetical protein
MTRNRKFLSLSALAALALASAPAPVLAQAGGTDSDKLEAIQKRLDAMNTSIKTAFDAIAKDMKGVKEDLNALKQNDADTGTKLTDAQMKIGTLEKSVNQLRTDIEALQQRLPNGSVRRYPADDKGALDEIRARLDRIEDMLRRVVSTSLRPNLTPPSAGTGRLVLVNAYPDTVLFIINRQTYRLAPGQTAVVNEMPAGVFTFEVISQVAGSLGPRTRVLTAGETFTLTARP